MPRKYFRKFLPDSEKVRQHQLVARFGSYLHHPNLWHFNRDSVARAVAIGMLGGLVPGPLQMLTVLLIGVPLRCNLPVALLTTFFTNPFTIVPIYLVAYQYGRLLLGVEGNSVDVVPFEMDWTNLAASMQGVFAWMLSLGKPLAVGLVALGFTLAIAGYFIVHLAWRAHVVLSWRARKRRRARRRPGT